MSENAKILHLPWPAPYTGPKLKPAKVIRLWWCCAGSYDIEPEAEVILARAARRRRKEARRAYDEGKDLL